MVVSPESGSSCPDDLIINPSLLELFSLLAHFFSSLNHNVFSLKSSAKFDFKHKSQFSRQKILFNPGAEGLPLWYRNRRESALNIGGLRKALAMICQLYSKLQAQEFCLVDVYY